MSNSQEIKVWDLLVRIFHWSLLVSVLVAFITEDDLLSLHTWAGYSVAALIIPPDISFPVKRIPPLRRTPDIYRVLWHPPSLRALALDSLWGHSSSRLRIRAAIREGSILIVQFEGESLWLVAKDEGKELA